MQQMEFGEQSCNPLSPRRSAGVLGGSPKPERRETRPRNAERSNHIPNHKGAEENRRRAMSPCTIPVADPSPSRRQPDTHPLNVWNLNVVGFVGVDGRAGSIEREHVLGHMLEEKFRKQLLGNKRRHISYAG